MLFQITENVPLTAQVYRMHLAGDTSAFHAPGQFAQVKVPGFYLRRPISVCDWDEKTLTLVYQLVGPGTEALATLRPGQTLDLLTGLGNGFDVQACGQRPLLVGGGVGLPPLVGLARRLMAAGKEPRVLAGFRSGKESFLLDTLAELGVPVTVTTADGSAGVRGLVTDALPGLNFDSLCACGPLPMLRALTDATNVPAQLSFEERMGCGFGACMGCSIKVKGGYKRVCREGPVLDRQEVIW